ncbi:hypothetical protein [Aeropyrum camini]|uniref:OsmC-like protein n=1 Tax=Aeropyrum camini SY1 = JCM 12091 TaxID=1198449 RepID=U3TED6_9CREN|nr:hypothetical protein [Aeropyrum camini]BAN90806.1 hypothetical protein ACAM_1337 [Aeropyrum camini SY1 = JCM 12091]
MPTIKFFEAKSLVDSKAGKAVVEGDREFELATLNPSFMLSLLSACIGKKVAENASVDRVSVSIEAYVDIDKLLDGSEEIEYIVIRIRAPAPREVVMKGVENCPVLRLIDKSKVKDVIVENAPNTAEG